MQLSFDLPSAAALHKFIKILDYNQQPQGIDTTHPKKCYFPDAKTIASHGNFTRKKIPTMQNGDFLLLPFDENGALMKTYIIKTSEKDSKEVFAIKLGKVSAKLFGPGHQARRIAVARFEEDATIPAQFDLLFLSTLIFGFRVLGAQVEEFVLFNDFQYFSTLEWAWQEHIKNPFEMFS